MPFLKPLSAPVTSPTHTLVANEFAPCDTSSNAITATLPTAPLDGTVAGLKLVTIGGTNAVTYNTGTGDVIDKTGGPTSGTLSLLNQGIYLQYHLADNIWYILGDDLPLLQLDGRYPQSGMYVPIGTAYSGKVLLDYTGGGGDFVNSRMMSGDAFARVSDLAEGYSTISSPYAPPRFGVAASPVGSGHDFQQGIESLADTAAILNVSMPRVHLWDGTTNYLHVSLYPWTGSTINSTINVQVDDGVMLPNVAGSVTVDSVFFGTGTINYTGTTGSGGPGTNGTLTGCTSSGISPTFTDTSTRWLEWYTDSYGAVIRRLGNFGGEWLNDQFTFSYLGVTGVDPINDIIVGYTVTPHSTPPYGGYTRTNGAAVTFGSDGMASIYRPIGTDELSVNANGSLIGTWALSGLTMAEPIAMGSNKITGLANGSLASDAATFGQVLGGQVEYASQASSNMVAALSSSANTWLAFTNSPSVTLPNDGNTYRIELSASGVQSSIAGIIMVGVGTSTSMILAAVQLQAGVASDIGYLPHVVAQKVIGSGQIISVYGATALTSSPTLTIKVSAAGNTVLTPCELAAYRVA